jgi:hypothetical protein
MTGAVDMTEDERGLDELAQIDLRLARVFAARAEAAEDPEVANGLVRSYQRAARSFRQTLALKHRLRRELKRELRDDRGDSRKEHDRAVSAHKAQVQVRLKTLIWTEAEGEEAERLEDELEDLLADDALLDGFTDTPVDAHVARLRHDLGLTNSEGGGSRSDAEASTPPDGPDGPPQPAFADSSPDGGATDPQSSA